jgi:DNA-binding SARP family transcriptional activator
MARPVFEFHVLGPLEVSHEGVFVHAGGPQQRMLLATLLLHPNEAVPLTSLISHVWDEPPSSARGAVQNHISRLRRILEDPAGAERLLTRNGGYVLHVDEVELDLIRFLRKAENGRSLLAQGSYEQASIELRSALSLWRGPVLVDEVVSHALQAQVSRLETIHSLAFEGWVDAELGLGRHREVVAELQRVVNDDALNEALWERLILALYRSDRQAEALAAYKRVRDQLREELGVDPSPTLKHLERAVLQQDPILQGVPALHREIGTTVPDVALAERVSRELASSAERAIAWGDVHTAASVLRLALELLPAGHPSRPALHASLAAALFDAGAVDAAHDTLQHALAEAQAATNTLGVTRLWVEQAYLRSLSTTASDVSNDRVLERAQEAVQSLMREQDHQGTARAWQLITQVRYVRGELHATDRADAQCKRFLQLAKRDEWTPSATLPAVVVEGSEPLDHSVLFEAEQALAGTPGIEFAEVASQLGRVYAMSGDDEAAERLFLDGLRVAQALRLRIASGMLRMERGFAAWQRGDSDLGVQDLTAASALFEEVGAIPLETTTSGFLALVYADMGMTDEAVLLSKQVEEACGQDDITTQVAWRMARALAVVHLDEERAERWSKEACALVEGTELLVLRGDAAWCRARVLATLNDVRAADEVRRALQLYTSKGHVAGQRMIMRSRHLSTLVG